MITPITTSFYYGYELPARENFALIKQAGFDGVHIWWSDGYGRHDYREYPDLARQAGLFIENFHADYEKFEKNALWLDKPSGDALTEHYLSNIDDCVRYEVQTLVLHLSNGDNPPLPNELGLNRIKKLADYAEKCGVNLAFENVRRAEHLAYVLDNVDSSRVGFCFDSGHQNCFTPNVDLLTAHGSRLMALHLHDNDGSEDSHLLPFDGAIDWDDTMRKIAQTGYTGSITMEAGSEAYHKTHSPEQLLAEIYQRGKRLGEMMG